MISGPAGTPVVPVFLAFAFAYFLSALLRAVTATLAPLFSQELALGAAQLGLLAGTYFLGFAAMQLPLGHALDRFGPRRSLLVLVGVALLGCLGFAAARGFAELLLARLVIGIGVSACLMAPLTCFRHRFSSVAQLRANSWMLMTGSLGMLSSTLPVQWLLPWLGWRGLFVAVAALLALAMAVIAWQVPPDEPTKVHHAQAGGQGYRLVFNAPAFIRLAPMGFVVYGGLIAMQTLWIGPWLTQVGGNSPSEAARGLFIVNASMLLAFLCWGLAMPRLLRSGWNAERLIAIAWPLSVICLALIVWQGPRAGAAMWAAWCVCTSVISLSQPALAQTFAPALAGRALSAFNLLIFCGVFAVQWGIGLLLDALETQGWPTGQAYRASIGAYLALCIAAFLWPYGPMRNGRASMLRR